jgi:hypothetical protein
MAEKIKDPDPVASAMAQKRWDKTGKKERSEIGKAMAEARWGKKKKKKKAKK